MSIVKISALTCSGFILWLAPPFILSRKIPLHNLTTGLALIGSFACCFEACRVALELSQVEEFEAMKEAVIVADTEDELATSAYISEQQRRMEAESILNVGSEDVQQLERSLALTCIDDGESEPERSQQLAENDDSERLERILQLQLNQMDTTGLEPVTPTMSTLSWASDKYWCIWLLVIVIY